MRVRLLGTAAGGGFPQWNCNCANCRVARVEPQRAQPRTQSCVAISADGTRWFLLNASPDIRIQIESFPPLQPQPSAARGTGIEGVLLTNADLDHTLGLLIVREGARLPVHATSRVREALSEGLALDSLLECYCGVRWLEPPSALTPLPCADGAPCGLEYAAFPIPGKPPRFREGKTEPAPGDCVGYRFVDTMTRGRLLFLPDVAQLDARVLAELHECDALLLDGTFWSENEMERMGAGTTPASRMGHLPIGGPDGSLAQIAPLPIGRKVYVHINNTNPILLADSPERAAVEATGATIGWDGMEFAV